MPAGWAVVRAGGSYLEFTGGVRVRGSGMGAASSLCAVAVGALCRPVARLVTSEAEHRWRLAGLLDLLNLQLLKEGGGLLDHCF